MRKIALDPAIAGAALAFAPPAGADPTAGRDAEVHTPTPHPGDMTRPIPPGWYPDPSGAAGMWYWNGIGWTAHRTAGAPAVTINNVVGPPLVSVASGPNHALHLILTIFTCGLWLPIWLIITLVNPRSVRAVWSELGLRGFVSAHPVLTAFGAFVAVGAIVEAWKVVLGIAIIAAIVAGLVMLVMLVTRSVQRRREEMAAIAARADDQHQAVLRGDDQWGVFGQQPPTPPPGWDSYTPIMAPPSTTRKPDQKWVIAGCAIAAGVVLFAALITDARSADRLSGPMPAPRVTDTGTPMAPPHRGMSAPAPYPPGKLWPSLTFPGIPFPSTNVAPNTPTGVPAKIGQQAVDGQLVFVVTSFDRSKTAGNPINPYVQVTATGIFVNAHVTITNTGTQPVVFFAADQKFTLNSVAFSVDAAAALWTLTAAVAVSPGANVPVTLSFDVPTDTPPGGRLELHESSMSRGVDVALLPPN
jgi:Domain of unknown function (DUF4352)/Protein of unknown function (DUF2510)